MLCVNVNEAVSTAKIKRVIIRTFLLISIAYTPNNLEVTRSLKLLYYLILKEDKLYKSSETH